MRRILPSIKKLIANPWSPIILAIAGWLYYLGQAWHTAHFKTSYLDEGMYLYKGLLFATGKYVPYADYGVWTNQMPFSYLIPGYIQKWFGPGLATGRYFMIAVASLTLLGLWMVVNRWSGKWWAAGAVWALSLNPMSVKVYTLAITEGLIACMMIWMLVLVMGIKRPTWQIMLAPILAVVMFFTRLNLGFVLPIVLLYIFWQYGWRKGLWATLVSVLAFAGIMSLFWPGIMKHINPWLPAIVRQVVSPLTRQAYANFPKGSLGTGTVDANETSTPYLTFLYFWLTIRVHFVPLVSGFIVWLLWPWKTRMRISSRLRAVVLVSALFGTLLGAHLWASFAKNYCVSCILLYTSFFDYLGLILLPLAFRVLRFDHSLARKATILVFIVLTVLGAGFSAYEDIDTEFSKVIIEAMRNSYPWQALQNFTGLSALMLFRRMTAITGSLLVLLVLLGGYRLLNTILSRYPKWKTRSVSMFLLSFLALGLTLSPTKILGKGNDFFDCGNKDVIESYAEAGEYLRGIIPPGSTIYWEGRIVAIFLYLPDIHVYPPQLNHTHSYLIGGDADALFARGYWNYELAQQWINDADYVLLEKGLAQDWELQTLSSPGYLQLPSTRKVERCRWQSIIDIYQRVK
jgi:hypothetical protein